MDTLPNRSYWIDSTPTTNYSSLNEDISVDVAVIGGGITGITTALLLKRDGVKVALLEASKILNSCTGHTTAKVTSQHHLIYDKLINTMGFKKAKQYADANENAINFIENIMKEYGIDCDFVRAPSYMYTQEDKYVEALKKEFTAAEKLGIKSKLVNSLPIELPIKIALCFENQAQFHPRKYLLPLAEKIPGNGCYLFENTPIIDVKDEDPVLLITDSGKHITAQKIVIASHFPCFDGLGFYFAKLKAKRSYAIAAKIKESFPNAMFINVENPGRSLRSQKSANDELVIIGGEGHKTAHGEITTSHFDNLKKWGKELFQVEDILYKWSTQDYVTLDNVPYIGPLTSSTESIYVATGFGEWGMTTGTAAGIILKDIIISGSSPYMEVFNPSRTLSGDAYKSLLALNFDVAKELILGKFKAPDKHVDIDSYIDIAKGTAKIIEIDHSQYGAYRDEEGILHIVDITCTHMGCKLKWNSAEKSWDCPCHGSRFSYEGEILEGPALYPLNHYKEGNNPIDPNIL